MDELITVAEAAELKNVTQHAIRAALQQGVLQGGKRGGRYLVVRDSLKGYVPRIYGRYRKEGSRGGRPRKHRAESLPEMQAVKT